jgi:hypothetical protein
MLYTIGKQLDEWNKSKATRSSSECRGSRLPSLIGRRRVAGADIRVAGDTFQVHQDAREGAFIAALIATPNFAGCCRAPRL